MAVTEIDDRRAVVFDANFQLAMGSIISWAKDNGIGSQDIDMIAGFYIIGPAIADQMCLDIDFYEWVGIAAKRIVAHDRLRGQDANAHPFAGGDIGKAAACLLHDTKPAAGQNVKAHFRNEFAEGGDMGKRIFLVARAHDANDRQSVYSCCVHNGILAVALLAGNGACDDQLLNI